MIKLTRQEKARQLRYKRPALASVGYQTMEIELGEIVEKCNEIQYFIDEDDDTLLNALDGNEEDEYEFKMSFSDLTFKAERLYDAIHDSGVEEYFDDCTVALIGNQYNAVGYDSFEEDYYSLTRYEQELAYTESGKRLMRKTKEEMISMIGQCFGIVIAYLDLRQSYDYLKATFDILRDDNLSILKMIKEIEAAYEAAEKEQFSEYAVCTKKFDGLVKAMPEKLWLE